MKGFKVLVVLLAAVSLSSAGGSTWGEYAGNNEGNFVVKITRTSDNQFLCMGSIIYDQWVLTTAHCLENENITITAGSKWFTTYSRGIETSLQSRLVTSNKYYVVHPNYIPQNEYLPTVSENIGLVYIDEPFDFAISPQVSRLLLPSNDFEPHSGKVFSWGERFYLYFLGSKLHITNVSKVYDNEYCAASELQPEAPYLLCSSGHSSPRYLDEGGPLVATTLKGQTLVGIVNTQVPGKEDVNPWFNVNLPTHYTSVPYLVTWIFDAISFFLPPDY